MINLVVDNWTQKADIERYSGNIVTSDMLYTAVTISLFTNRRALSTDVLPDEQSMDYEGWWADAYAETQGDLIGSRLWLLRRSKATQETANLAKLYAEEALQWLIEDGVAKSVVVEAEPMPNDILGFKVSITRTDKLSSRWDAVWKAHIAEL